MKAAERILKYGIKAYLKMRGLRKTASRILFYQRKYPTAKLELPSLAPHISRSQRSYWKDVKALSEERDIPIKETRKLLKGLKTDRNVQVRVIKSGEGWQLIMLGLYENADKDDIYFKQREESLGHSFVHRTETNYECYDDALEECIKEAQAKLGGSGWQLIKILKETWIRYYGREE